MAMPQSYTKKIDVARLVQEIQLSTITVAFDHLEYDPLTLAVKPYFKAELGSADKAILDSIIQNHSAIPLPDEPEYLVTPIDKRQIVKPSIRPLMTSGHFTSVGDNTAVWNDKGGGSPIMKVDHKIGDTDVILEQRFNAESNQTWLWDGYIQWNNANFDLFTFEIRAVSTPYTDSTGTGFYKHPTTGVILPSVLSGGIGNISIDTATIMPVSTVPKTDTGISPAAYWNATFSNGVYSNLTPAPAGDGKYNLFWTDVLLKRYINKFCMIGDGNFCFLATDPSQMGTNLKLIYKFITNTPDHDWKACLNVSMFREKIS